MNLDSVLTIDGVDIGPGHNTYFIADIAANHDGDLSRAKDLIYLAAEAGADGVCIGNHLHFTEDSYPRIKYYLQTKNVDVRAYNEPAVS